MNMTKWFRISYNKITGSIAFFPALIALGFLLLSWGMLEIDFSEWGKHLKAGLSWLSLKDASTARSIISTVAGAIISLTVFSFSMVMIVLNQAASQMSNRVLSSMIENRFQQVVLGFYIGTIVYALFLLSTIRDISSGIYVPALSIYLLILLTVIDIFLFIYFLDYVTQTVKYETVINRVQKQTINTMKKNFQQIKNENITWKNMPYIEIHIPESNYFQGFNKDRLLSILAKENLYVCFLYRPASYLIKGTAFLKVYSNNAIDDACIKDISDCIDLFRGQPIDTNADYGFNQLAEVAIKALSPGINDPATAVLSLHALFNMFAYRLYCHMPPVMCDETGVERLYIPSTSFIELFNKCISPVWSYGQKDEYIQNELLAMLKQLKAADNENKYNQLFNTLFNKVQQQKDAALTNN